MCGPKASRILGLAASFGSDRFSDRRFHYGHVLCAAAVVAADVLAADDPALTGQRMPVVKSPAAVVATQADGRNVSERQTLAAWAGRSWAGSTSPLADDNNRESSPEPVNACKAPALWASASNQPEFATKARWMLAATAESALDCCTRLLHHVLHDGALLRRPDHNVTSID